MRTYFSSAFAFIFVLAACHHERTPTPTGPTPPTTASVSRPRPHAMAARVPAPSDAEVDRLAADLRAPDRDPTHATLTRWVRGPLVILDGDDNQVRTACGDDAQAAASKWGLALVDPTKPDPHCQAEGSKIFCEQRGIAAGDRTVGLYFDRAGADWVLSGVILSRISQEPRSSAIGAFGVRLARAQCPGE